MDTSQPRDDLRPEAEENASNIIGSSQADINNAEPPPPPKSNELTQTEKILTWIFPNVGDIIFCLVLWLLLSLLPTFLFGDGSTGWHIATGNHVLAHGIPTTDFLSYTHPHMPWVAYQWLSDVFMAKLVQWGGLNLLAVTVASLLAFFMLLVYERCRKEGANFMVALTLVLIGALVSAIHWLARPHIFNFFGVYFFYTLLEDYWRGTISAKKLLITLPLIMVLWVNVHPACLLGLVLVAIYLFSAIVLSVVHLGTEKLSGDLAHLRELAIAMVCCVVATLCNPYGIKLHEYIGSYLKGTAVLAATDEFMSPVFHGALQPVCLEILFAAFIVGLAVSRKRLSFPRLLTCLAFSHLALSAVRNMPLFVVVMAPAISQLLSHASLEPQPSADMNRAWWQPLLRKWNDLSSGFDENEKLCNKHGLSVLTFLILSIAAIGGGKLLGQDVLASGWNPKNKPTASIEYLRKAEASGTVKSDRGFNYDNWGGYIFYVLGTPVFIDDRADYYGEDFYRRYAAINMVQPGWQKLLDGEIYKGTPQEGKTVDWILVPKMSALAAALRSQPQWGAPVSEDEASCLFFRSH